MLFTFSQGCSLPFPRDEMFTFPQESFSFPLGFVYASPVINICYLFPGILFTFPQGCCLPFPKDIVYLSSGCYLSFPRDIVYLSPWICLPFPRDVVYLCPGMSFTFPQGESQAGSPGLLAFQSAKSRSDFLSPGFWLSSPVQKKNKKTFGWSWQNNDFLVLSLDDHITECKIPSPSAKASRSPTASGTNLA